MIFFAAAYFLSYFFRSANAVIAADLRADLSLSAADLGLMSSFFFAAFAAVQLPLGVGLDRWGPRWVTPGLMLIGALGSLLFALAPSFLALALGRALIGAGMGGVLMGSLKALSAWFPPARFATISGLFVAFGALGALGAATPLAWLNERIGWRNAFLLGAAAIALSAFAIMLFTRNSPAERVPTSAEPAPSLREVLVGVGAVFRDQRFWRMAPMNFFLLGTLLAFQGLWAGPYLFDTQGIDKQAAGNMLLPIGIGSAVGYAFAGWLGDRIGSARAVLGGGLLAIACQIGLLLRPSVGIGALFFVFGLAGAFNLVLLAQARQIFPSHLTGRAFTAVNLFGFCGSFLVQWLMGVIIGSFAPAGATSYPPSAYSAALAATTIGMAVSLMWYLPLVKAEG